MKSNKYMFKNNLTSTMATCTVEKKFHDYKVNLSNLISKTTAFSATETLNNGAISKLV